MKLLCYFNVILNEFSNLSGFNWKYDDEEMEWLGAFFVHDQYDIHD